MHYQHLGETEKLGLITWRKGGGSNTICVEGPAWSEGRKWAYNGWGIDAKL